MTDHDLEPPAMLSPVGQARRDEILALTLRRVRQRRRTRRVLGGTAGCTLIVGVIATLLQAAYGPVSTEPGLVRITTMPDPVPRITTLTLLQQPASALSASASTWEVLDDQGLLLALRSAGRPATLSRNDGRARVIFADAQR